MIQIISQRFSKITRISKQSFGVTEPFCADCTYVDLKNHQKGELAEGRFVQADARALPMADQSVSFILTLGFPWFRTSWAPLKYVRHEIVAQESEKIRAILGQYKRVLISGGMVTIFDGAESVAHRRRKLELHSQIATELGFRGTEIKPLVRDNGVGRGYEVTLSVDRIEGLIEPNKRAEYDRAVA